MDCRIPYLSNISVTIGLEDSVPLSVSKTRGQPQRFTINSSKAFNTDFASAFLKAFSSTYLVNKSSKTIMYRLPVRDGGFGPIISEATTHGSSRFLCNQSCWSLLGASLSLTYLTRSAIPTHISVVAGPIIICRYSRKGLLHT